VVDTKTLKELAGGTGKDFELVKKNNELKWSQWVQGTVALRASTFPKVFLQLFGAKGLKNADGHPGGLNDVYCKLIWCGKEVQYSIHDTHDTHCTHTLYSLVLIHYTHYTHRSAGQRSHKTP
jgi:hypothetical protein